jgi:hypothetical protein
MSTKQSLEKLIDFPPSRYVLGRPSIADLFPPKRRCGIYILHFTDGWYYVGQAIDVTRRYSQHCQNHDDIERISFKPFSAQNLNAHEQRVIAELERNGYKLRNVALVSIPHWESDFDALMSPNEQSEWLSNLNISNVKGKRVDHPELRQRYRKKFQRLEKLPFYQDIAQILREYVHKCIPSVVEGEMSFWCCTCLPHYNDPTVKIYSRINIYWQEVFTAFLVHGHGQPYFSFHLAHSLLTTQFGPRLSGLKTRYRSLEVTDHYYNPGGRDQCNLVIGGISETRRLLNDVSVLPAIREFNLRLSKKGACVFSRYHCLDLADKLIG